MKKHYVIAFLFCCITAMLCAGGKKEPPTAAQAKSADNSSAQAAYTVKVVVPANAPAICIAKMASDAAAVADGAVTEYEVLQAPDMLQARLLSGEADIAIVPSNLSAILYAKGTGVRLAGAVVWGILYGLTSESVNSIEDLKGKTIITFGRGLTPDVTVRELLNAYGLTPDKDVIFNYVQSGQEAAAAFISGKGSFVILPEPMVSMVLTKKSGSKVFLDVQNAWKEKLRGRTKKTHRKSSRLRCSLLSSTGTINKLGKRKPQASGRSHRKAAKRYSSTAYCKRNKPNEYAVCERRTNPPRT